jgi:hypothetical protein
MYRKPKRSPNVQKPTKAPKMKFHPPKMKLPAVGGPQQINIQYDPISSYKPRVCKGGSSIQEH